MRNYLLSVELLSLWFVALLHRITTHRMHELMPKLGWLFRISHFGFLDGSPGSGNQIQASIEDNIALLYSVIQTNKKKQH